MGQMKPVGTLDPACPEAQWWLTIVGSLDVPLTGPIPLMATTGNPAAAPQKVYFVDVTRLNDRQIEGICKVMSAKYNVPIGEVRAGIRKEHGLPIRADRLSMIAFQGRIAV